jgi:hypothetical protein
MHHQGLSQLQQLAAASTEINLNPRMLLKQERVKVVNGGKKYRKKASTANNVVNDLLTLPFPSV